MDISALREQTKDITVTLGAISFSASYYPGRYTRQMQKDIDKREKAAAAAVQAAKDAGEEPPEDNDVSGIAEMVVALIASWDLTDQKKPLPVTVDSCVDRLGYIYTLAVLRAILDDVTAGTGGPNSPKANGAPTKKKPSVN